MGLRMDDAATQTTETMSRTDLRTIAHRQKVILTCIVMYIMALLLLRGVADGYQILPAVVALLVFVTAAIYVFLLATKLYGVVAGILMGILVFIPLIGLIVLLIIASKATRVLRAHGIEVGLLGANVPEEGR